MDKMDKMNELAQSLMDKRSKMVKVGKWEVAKEVYDFIVNEQKAIDIEKAKEAFCKARCPLQYEMYEKECWRKACPAFLNFCKAMEE